MDDTGSRSFTHGEQPVQPPAMEVDARSKHRAHPKIYQTSKTPQAVMPMIGNRKG